MRFELAENRRIREYIRKNREGEKEEKNEQCIKEMWDTVMCTNICIKGIPEGWKRKRNKK